MSEEEIKNVVTYLKKQDSAQTLDSINLEERAGGSGDSFIGFIDGNDSGDDDELYEDAKQAVIEAGKASTSYLQRKLRVGYSRAARLVDLLEERGVISPADGAKPRKILDDENDQLNEESDDGQINEPEDERRF
ncbi:hypothetical protein CO026_00210 [Candidatus Kaiserbacteria bacterium CG_4_9_14_0_2_um_filter_41_32]|uniref:FtsK gamma domain-containing protein n=1 Tax=Candidatus Kaiserbacteria bacterium CG_4_9_14_0_2_um_filter_41_32 TaxID=1974601 RepID=A0A2M8FFN5_9BACT|nr:MAG: hypothetical protein CO026_00210 [Candidatus Kaiserbacteria bacterium CG_4_9_14_0_2_um_filter_41_32]